MHEDIWYLGVNGVSEIPTNVLGQGVQITVVDSCIDFTHRAISAVHVPSHDDWECTIWLEQKHKDLVIGKKTSSNDWTEFAHGTATAGLIAAKKVSLEFHNSDGVKRYYVDHGINKVTVEGIAKKCKINGVKKPIDAGSVKQALNDRKLTSNNNPKFPKMHHSKMVLFNFSGGRQELTVSQINDWNKLIKETCDHGYTLMIASVGNAGCNLENSIDCKGVWPAYANSSNLSLNCSKGDPILRVGAVSKYNIGQTPTLYSVRNAGSNFGNKHVDILAPGHEIPTLVPYDHGTIIGGTSLAAGLVSGLAAILASCQPLADALEIKEAILQGATEYSSLQYKAYNGRVLNMLQSVKNFCFIDRTATIVMGSKKEEL